MTDLTRSIVRRTEARHFSRGRRKRVIVEFQPPGTLLTFRLEGERKRFCLAVTDCYTMAVQAYVAAEKRRRADERKARKAKR